MLLDFVQSVNQVRKNSGPYKKWEKEQEDKEARRQELHKTAPISSEKLEYSKNYGNTLINIVDVMDRYSEDKGEDAEIAAQTAGMLGSIAIGVACAGVVFGMCGIPFIKKKIIDVISKRLPGAIDKSVKEVKKLKNFIPDFADDGINALNKAKELTFNSARAGISAMAFTVASFVSTMIAIPLGTNLQITGSRIARYQARQTELKEPRNFVIYTPEQIEEAKANLKGIEVYKKKKKEFYNPVKEYAGIAASVGLLWKDYKNYKTWQDSNNNAELDINKLFAPLVSPEKLEKAKEDQDIIFRTVRNIDIASQTYSEKVELASGFTKAMIASGGAILGGAIQGLIEKVQSSGKLRNNFTNIVKNSVTPFFAVAVPILMIPLFTTIKKEAAKLGRLKAKQELLSDPKNFVYYTDSKIAELKNIKSPDKKQDSLLKEIVDDVKFLFKSASDYEENNEGNELKYQQEQRLREELKKIKITPEQLEKAKSLQRKVFLTFDKMDEKSQKYSEDIEAASELADKAISPVFRGISLLGLGASYMHSPIMKAASLVVYTATQILPFYLDFIYTKLQLKASKIGTMEAIQELKDPIIFMDK